MAGQSIRPSSAFGRTRVSSNRGHRAQAPWDELVDDEDWDDLDIVFFRQPFPSHVSGRIGRDRRYRTSPRLT
jgi:hypothetical protein